MSNDTKLRARRRLAALALALVLAGYGLSIYAATTLRAPTPTEAAFAQDGVALRRAAGGPLDALAQAPPASLVLVDPPALLSAERDALRSYAEEGGTLWIVSLHPQDALWPRLAAAVHVLPGAIYGADGDAARYRLGDAQSFPRGQMQALLVDGATTLLASEGSAVRDTNGDGVLQSGEPTGPFGVAARVAVGRGAVILVAAQPLDAGQETLAYGRMAPDAPRSGVVVDHEHPGAWSKPARAALAMLAAVPALWWLDALLAIIVTAALLVVSTSTEPSAPRSQKPADLVRSLEASMTAASLPASHPFWSALEEEE